MHFRFSIKDLAQVHIHSPLACLPQDLTKVHYPDEPNTHCLFKWKDLQYIIGKNLQQYR